MAEKDFPAPSTPRTLKQMVRQIKEDPDFAEFFHEKVKAARHGDQAAQNVVKMHFEPQTEELKDFQLSESDALALRKCTDPRTHLADFAYYVVYTVS